MGILTKRDGWRFVAALLEPGDFDQTERHELEVKLKALTCDEWAAAQSANKLQRQVLEDTLLDARAHDEDGQPLPFDDQVKAALLNQQWVVRGLFGYQTLLQGGLSSAEARQVLLGNLPAPATTGSTASPAA